MTLRSHQTAAAGTDGRRCVRRFFLVRLMIATMLVAPASVWGQTEPQVSVREHQGLYTVTATFRVPAPMETVTAVLTDYDDIPRFMPAVRTSIVRARTEHRAVVEQEATARFMMFSRRVHLVLDILEAGSTIGFRDRCGQSFKRYEGSWTLTKRDEGTEVEYVLAAEPAFDVPGFLLSRLLKRDSAKMIDGLKTEIADRARVPVP